MTHDRFDPALPTRSEADVPQAVHRLTRRLLTIATPREARALAAELISELGALTGEGAPCTDCDPDIEVSFGDGEPVFPCAPRNSIARRLVRTHLPVFIEDARQVLDNRRWAEKLAHDSGVDPLTGLLERSAMGRLMARLQEGDLLIAIDLDDFKRVNEEDGRAAGDAVLRAFARALRGATRANENCARMRSDEFLVVLYQADADETAMIFLDRLRRRWREMATSLPAFSAGIAQVRRSGWRPAIMAADRALQRAKADPAGFWVTACDEDYV